MNSVSDVQRRDRISIIEVHLRPTGRLIKFPRSWMHFWLGVQRGCWSVVVHTNAVWHIAMRPKAGPPWAYPKRMCQVFLMAPGLLPGVADV